VFPEEVSRSRKRNWPRRRWEDNIKTDLQEVGGERVVVTGWSWLRIGTDGGHLCVR
jgi:hypothetical protein